MKIPELHQAIYVSKSVRLFDSDSIDRLLRISQHNNKEANITGYLYFEDGYFLQYLEAYDKSVIEKLLKRLLSDSRHIVLNWTFNTTRRTRRFSDWSMRWIKSSNFKDLSLEDKIIDLMKSLASRQVLEEVNETKIWHAMDVVAKHKKYFEL